MNHYTFLAAAVTVTLLSACSSDGTINDSGSTNGNQPGNQPGSGQDLRKLRVIESSDAFYEELEGALIAQASGGRDTYTTVQGGAVNETADSAEPAPVPAPTSPGAESADSNTVADGDSQPDVTGTNVQEVGVDEQDRVKNSSDGRHLYVLHNDYPEVYPVDGPVIDDTPGDVPVAPPVDSPDEPGVGTSPAPQNFATVLRILELDAATPDATPVRDVAIDLTGRQADGMYLHENGDERSILLTSTGSGYWQNWQDSAAFSGLDSVITRIDVSEPAEAAITANFRIDGQIISSRRIGKYMFFASRYYPTIPGVDPWSQTPEEWQATVEATDLATLMPQYTNDGSSTITPLVDPAGCFVAEKPENDQWYTPDIITLGVIDLDTMDLTDSECYLGATETLYASPNAVFLATTKWDYSYGPGAVPEPEILEEPQIVDPDDATQPAPIPYYDPRVDTDIHQFDINGGSLVYIGSGSVRGHLGWNPLRKPFRMSEHNGYLRVATFSDELRPGVSPINISVLEADGQGSLTRIAELPNENRPEHIGKPGEQLYASRFLGDKAYLVTFRQTDPLYVVDMSNPSDPFLAGELEIAGYSDYLQPIGESFLLGIGKDAVAADDGWGDGRGALAQGVKLSLFDVSDPSAPREVQSVIVGQRGTESTALHNHHAITIQAATDQHPTRVAFGIDVAGNAMPDSQPSGDAAFDWHEWNYTGLHGFEVRTGSDAGITTTGVLQVENSAGPYSYPGAGDDRSVMVNDSVFYIHGANVWSAPWNDMANPVGPR